MFCDFKMLQIVCCLHYQRNMKYPCPFCLFDSYSPDRYNKEVWPSRTLFELQSFGVIHIPLISTDDIILPVLHIKLGLFKQFVKWMDKTIEAYLSVRKSLISPILPSFLTSFCHGKNTLKSILMVFKVVLVKSNVAVEIKRNAVLQDTDGLQSMGTNFSPKIHYHILRNW